MRISLAVPTLLVLCAMGCSKVSPGAAARGGHETFTLSEADTLIAQTIDPGPDQGTPPEFTADNAVVNSEVFQAADIPAASVSPDLPNMMIIQTSLKNLGLYQGELDGKIGPQTREAIRKFQRQNNLVVDGKVGPKTWALLKQGLPEEPSLNRPVSPPRASE